MKLPNTAFFLRDQDNLTPAQVIWWWESRRPAYNLFVGLAGVFSCVIAVVSALIVESFGKEAIFPDPPLFAIFAVFLYGIAANICYTGGWFFELACRKLWSARTGVLGSFSFVLGLVGSVALTLLPAILIPVLSFIEVLTRTAPVR